MIKKRMVTVFLMGIALLSIFLTYRYYQYILVWTVNPEINVHGIKLMMTEDKVKNILGEEDDYIPGYAGCSFTLKYDSKGISVEFLGDIDTDFYHKVNTIQITHRAYEIFTIKVGDNYEDAVKTLQKRGFTRQNKSFAGYWKNSLYIVLEKMEDRVNSITIGVRDRIAGTRVY